MQRSPPPRGSCREPGSRITAGGSQSWHQWDQHSAQTGLTSGAQETVLSSILLLLRQLLRLQQGEVWLHCLAMWTCCFITESTPKHQFTVICVLYSRHRQHPPATASTATVDVRGLKRTQSPLPNHSVTALVPLSVRDQSVSHSLGELGAGTATERRKNDHETKDK